MCDCSPELLKELDKGYDIVYAYYEEIKQTRFHGFGSWMEAKMSEVMLGTPKGLKGSSFYVARRFVIDEMVKYQNSYSYLAGLVLRTTHNAAGCSYTISVIFIIGGLLLGMLGIVGEYARIIYIFINKSPQYVMKKTVE